MISQPFSITFDPFMYLSLPLPVKDERLIKIILIDKEGRPMKYGVRVPKSATVGDLKRKLAELSQKDEDVLVKEEFVSCLPGFGTM